ncbi:MAG: PilZ domain-containing protein [Hyphomicrobiaceae bacterium]|nr:PilZ domain-containing protein [Pseudomonadales bacterium]MCC0006801.1 PilZ domain-containing protein [Hyphomicrobiaceae bacterium]
MTVQALFDTQSDHVPGRLVEPERRLHKRFALKLIGRFMREDRHEYACQLRDISVGGLSLETPVHPEMGERIIVYIDELGGLEGTVVRLFQGGFAMTLSATQHKREKLAARITWLVNRHELEDAEARKHDRILPVRNTNTLKLSDEITLQAQIIDVSLSGANVATEARPPLGSEVLLGKVRAEVVRHHERGIAVRFIQVQEPEVIKKSFF